MSSNPEIAFGDDGEEPAAPANEAAAQPDAAPANEAALQPGAASPELDPVHLGRGVHVRGDGDVAGVHVDDAAMPSRSHTGAGLGGLQIGETRF
jgi:hypothetical protein